VGALVAKQSTLVAEWQLLNAPPSIVTTPLPILIDAAEVHPSKALKRMFVTLSGIVIEPKLLQYRKALRPITVILLGMTTEVRLLHPRKVSVAILV
jgi:hypothetical protein